MSSPMLRTGRRKISPPFGGFTPADGRGYFYGPILCLAAQILRWPWLGIGAEKRGGSGGSPPHKVHGGQPGALLALPKGRYFLLFTLPLLTSLCLAFYSYIFVTMLFGY